MPELVLCSNCGSPAKYRGKRLCARCYQRIAARGTAADAVREPCVVPGCEDLRKAWGYCNRHWSRVRKHGVPDPGKWSHETPDRCVVPGCGGEYRCMGLCERHYSAEARKGHPLFRTLMRRKVSPDRPWTVATVTDPAIILPYNSLTSD